MIADDLLAIADELESAIEQGKKSSITDPLNRLGEAAERVGEAWSGSWLGYHSCVYYADFERPPAGARFSAEWGLMPTAFVDDTRGDWREYTFADVLAVIRTRAGEPDLTEPTQFADTCRRRFESARDGVLTMLGTAREQRDDEILVEIQSEVAKLRIFSSADFIKALAPRQFMSRDSAAMGQGVTTPPHIAEMARTMELRQPPQSCASLSSFAHRAADHLKQGERYGRRTTQIGTHVFIGHGRSTVWRELKDFVQERLHLPWDEFNRVPVAGITNIARLSQMLDDAAVAFLIMTAEDEQRDGTLRARENVVHEAGLFQGRLGFTRAILLLEDGCEEFSNIQGLGQIRFPAGRISATFEDVRSVLERERLILS